MKQQNQLETDLTINQRIQILQAIAPALQRSSGLEFLGFFESVCRAITMPLDGLRAKINEKLQILEKQKAEQGNQDKSHSAKKLSPKEERCLHAPA